MEDDYLYQTYYGKIDEIMRRDDYTCQICGYYGVQAKSGPHYVDFGSAGYTP
jgi:hypothetical protein